ncbi:MULTISPECIES: TadE/TadG family type IV pilus assembly protein [Sphingomonas]|uniref:TadE/TadG family type IV pilus assembly protein n=1 Tax=Sphingomonas kyungheensis TaxID=1069987 RepID=A0ABU8H6U4_9SPHN|nr:MULTISPECIES: TadE/TadG family type IV pilus assembly protein [unclassified Sphingomonas]
MTPLPFPKAPRFAFFQSKAGTSIVEFAIVAPMFILLLIGVLETSYVYFLQESLETRAEATMRAIITGTLVSESSSDSARKAVCASLPSYMRCDRIAVEVAYTPEVSQIKAVALQSALPGRAGTGRPGDMVVLRLLYRWPMRLSPFSLVRGMKEKDGYALAALRLARVERYS